MQLSLLCVAVYPVILLLLQSTYAFITKHIYVFIAYRRYFYETPTFLLPIVDTIVSSSLLSAAHAPPPIHAETNHALPACYTILFYCIGTLK